MKNSGILLVSCPDQKGLVAAIANFLGTYNANILHADQHQDANEGLFLMRVEWDLNGFTLDISAFRAAFQPIADKYQMQWKFKLGSHRPKMAIMVSKYDHCLVDLLYRHQSQELACDIPLIMSNHQETQRIAEFYQIPFHYLPMTKDNKAAVEAKQIELIEKHQVDFIVLARYMQILSPDFIRKYPQRVINIHHSFLPAFEGAKPYHRAFERGARRLRRRRPRASLRLVPEPRQDLPPDGPRGRERAGARAHHGSRARPLVSLRAAPLGPRERGRQTPVRSDDPRPHPRVHQVLRASLPVRRHAGEDRPRNAGPAVPSRRELHRRHRRLLPSEPRQGSPNGDGLTGAGE